ncbi:hypothetical protein Zmor_009574 [Zophobas morio]|uniref:Ig-like domain-containing protein n=1 Tax=Zophobas morio TaxID=2755281 RepID=A0AA38IQW3_9CUCU|nr:hypothetical protein Zmor_009574 [Zophobas morio]
MSSAGFLVLVLVLLVTCSEAEPATEFAEASDGGTASLPCSLAPSHPPDKVTVVLWYRGTQESPIYKYDVRSPRPQHWADASLENRYFLRILDAERAVMSISPTKLSDEEMFHCRVDFVSSPTRITHVNLTIVGELMDGNYRFYQKCKGGIRATVKNVHFMCRRNALETSREAIKLNV